MKNLYQHQINFLKKNPHKSVLVHSCGTGKTRTSIEWSKLYNGNTLVICPKSLKANWRRELALWGGTADVLTKEEFRSVAQQLPRYDQIIVDEVHFFLAPHFKSQMSKAMRWYLKRHQVKRFLGLSATVYSSSPWNIYNLAILTGHSINWQKFSMAFFNQVRMGPRVVPVPKKNIEGKLAAIVKKIGDVVDIESCIDVPEQTFETEYFDLTEEQEKAMAQSYDPVHIVRFTKENQISSGILKGNEFVKDNMNISCLKNERILSLCEENKKIIIVCRYNLQIDLYSRLLARHSPYIIRGDVKDRDSVIRTADAAQAAVVLIQSGCSVGYELPNFRIMVFASMDFSWVNYKQMTGRILRITNPQKNIYLHLLAGETDEAVFSAISRKQDFNVALFYKK